MFRNDPSIAAADVRSARMFQALFPLAFRLQYSSPSLQFATRRIARPKQITVPTRHGDVRSLVYAPAAEQLARFEAAGQKPPVHVITHGGAFIVRVPRQEDNVARYLASEIGAYVVIPDYGTAPDVIFPVAEEQSYDVFQWVHRNAAQLGWDSERISVGGSSAGGKLALNVALLAIDHDGFRPVAVTSEYGVADLALSDEIRTSAKDKPVVAPDLLRLVRATYFSGADPEDPLASPARHSRLAELPPTLIMTAEFDTLRHESNRLAAKLAELGVPVTHHEFAGVDHGFTHTKPVETARSAIEMIGEHLQKAYSTALVNH